LEKSCSKYEMNILGFVGLYLLLVKLQESVSNFNSNVILGCILITFSNSVAICGLPRRREQSRKILQGVGSPQP
jgi:hypothetical protein